MQIDGENLYIAIARPIDFYDKTIIKIKIVIRKGK